MRSLFQHLAGRWRGGITITEKARSEAGLFDVALRRK
jgi:hypothetical protein